MKNGIISRRFFRNAVKDRKSGNISIKDKALITKTLFMNIIIPMAGMGKRMRPHTLTTAKAASSYCR